jgi:rare lipoprotein A (peptidoglycan hydrolase)
VPRAPPGRSFGDPGRRRDRVARRFAGDDIPRLDTASRSAGGRPGSTFLEPGTRKTPTRRVVVDQPGTRAGVFSKNYWRYDTNVSWYGPGFIGSGTACGQTYTKTLMGVAHRTLPCGTLVTFRNPANGRQITVPVIDRGPYVSGRQWDLSRGLCDYLDHCYTGAIEWRWGVAALTPDASDAETAATRPSRAGRRAAPSGRRRPRERRRERRGVLRAGR